MADIATDENNIVQPTSPPPFIDRLSLLPNELLDSIFESAYSDESPEAPLSKHLYPFFEQYFYRQVRLSSSRHVDLFLQTISNHPERGKFVKSLEFDRRNPEVLKSMDTLKTLFPLLPNLVHLEIDSMLVEVGFKSMDIFSTLSNVSSVTTEPCWDDNEFIDLDRFAFLSSLPSLSTLNVLTWPVANGAAHYEEEEEIFQLNRVKQLQIQGPGADDSTIQGLVDLCPSLVSLDLSTTYHEAGTSYGDCLPLLPTTLETLKLGSEGAFLQPTDDFLHRFTQLRHLDLDKGCYSSLIHVVLSQLPLLVNFRLGPGTVSPLGFLPLVSGSKRLANLRQIVLDFEVGKVGSRTSYDTYLTLTSEEKDGWEPSQDLMNGEDEDNEAEIGYTSGLRDFITVAEENGVRIRGTVHEALANFEDYWIEEYNRAVLDFDSLRGTEESEYLEFVQDRVTRMELELPSLDLDSLDLTRLELVKIDLPERNWWIYSLKNVENSQQDEVGTE